LRAVFTNKEDIHLSVTRAIYGDDTIKKSDPRREIGKMINLATSYGMSAKEMAKRIGITEDEADKFLRAYFNRFPDVDNFIARSRMLAQKKGYVETVMGRRVWMNEHNYQVNNNAINAPIQGSAADFTKVWINTFRTYCDRMNIEFPVVMVIHDEVVMDIPKDKESDYKIALDTSFKDTANKLFPTVPFEYEIFGGKSWACKKGEEE
jgi:DNA polymerase-1